MIDELISFRITLCCDESPVVFQKSNLDQVSMWLPYLKELKPVVQILVCESCSDDDGKLLLIVIDSI